MNFVGQRRGGTGLSRAGSTFDRMLRVLGRMSARSRRNTVNGRRQRVCAADHEAFTHTPRVPLRLRLISTAMALRERPRPCRSSRFRAGRPPASSREFGRRASAEELISRVSGERLGTHHSFPQTFKDSA